VLGVSSQVQATLVAIPAALLVAAGAAKLAGVGAAQLRSALDAVGVSRKLARPLALLEVAVGIACLVHPDAVSLTAMALLYLTFGVVTARRRMRGDAESCGCLWDDGAPDWLHVAIVLIAAVIAAASITDPPPSLVSIAADDPVLALPLVLAIGTAVYCIGLVAAYLGSALSAYRPEQGA
jgi:hypothetical protein